MVSSSDMARRFAEFLDRAGQQNERLFVTRNNEIQAVLLSVEDFARLSACEEIIEHLLVARLIESRRTELEVTDLEALLQTEGLDLNELRRIDPE